MESEATSLSPPSSPPVDHPSQPDMVVQRLLAQGVPKHYLDAMEMGLVQFVNEKKGRLQDIVCVLMPGVEEAQLLADTKEAWQDYKQGYLEGLRLAQWLMFGGDPGEVMKEIQQETGHVRGVCGTVWGSNEIAYRCRTCENDPTCAICVSCFELGNHVNHDYSMIHTGGGCCDCGDVTAWKEAGFCSRHSGPGQAASLSPVVMATFEPVMDALLNEWAKRLQAAAMVSGMLPKKRSDQAVEERVATQTSLALVEILLHFFNCSESLLTVTGDLIASAKVGLLDLLLKSECFLPIKVLNKLHELLFKLMGNPKFKYQFAKVFIHHYPQIVRDGLRQNFELFPSLRRNFELFSGVRTRENSTLSSFSVQIFTVPTLTPQLVVDSNLLDMLLEVLKDAFLSCSEGDGQHLASKGPVATSFYLRIIDDIRFVLRHPEVVEYVARKRLDLIKAWLHLLAFTQGMDSQGRQTERHVEEENDNWNTAYVLEVQMASIHPLLIDGAATSDSLLSSSHGGIVDEDVVHGHAKIGRISIESDVSGKGGSSSSLVCMDLDGASGVVDHVPLPDKFATHLSRMGTTIPPVLLWSISECAKVLDIWFLLDAYREIAKSKRPSVQKGRGTNQQRGMYLRGRGGRGIVREFSGPALDISEGETLDFDVHFTGETMLREQSRSLDSASGSPLLHNVEVGGVLPQATMQESMADEDEYANWWMGPELPNSDVSAEFMRIDKEWLEIDFDVGQQETSFHIPLHRFLAVALQKALETSPELNHKEGNKRSWHCQDHLVSEKGFLLQLLPPCYQVPAFISLLMEHPLRIQVFCAQVRAGMWRRNGQSAQALCEHYNSVKWCEESSDLDLFLLQCCGAMAPTEDFVERIVSRFGLANYFSLFLLRPNEYETTMAQHMLALLIRIVVERGLCGFSAIQSCRRELIKRLAVSDATHSQLMKALPSHLHENKHWKEILFSVATYYKPSGMQQGRFSLRPECWKELDLYHPRWNARELQSAEDRYLRACKESAIIKQVPQWQKPFAPFQNLSKLATCRRVHDMLRSTFFHAVFSENMPESRAPENVLLTALHLLALGLDVCSLFVYKKGWDQKFSDYSSSSQDGQEPPPLLGNATERVYFGGVDGMDISNRQSLLSLLVLLMRKYDETEAFRTTGELHQCGIGALINSLLEKFSHLHSGCMYEIEALAPEILHRVLSHQDNKVDSDVNVEAEAAVKKKLLARERQAAVMAKMKAAQEKFVASFQSSQDESDTDNERPQSRSPRCTQVNYSESHDENSRQFSMAISCALCRDSNSNSPLSFLTFVQRSRLLTLAEKGVSLWEKGDRPKSSETTALSKGVDSGSLAIDSEIQESQIRVELLNLIQMALNGEVDREGPIEVEALLEFLGDEGFVDPMDGGQSFVEARMSETTSSDTGSDASLEEENVDDLPNVFPDFLGDFSDKDEVVLDEEEKDKTRQSFMITVLLEYVNILSRCRKQQQQLEMVNSATLPMPQRQHFSRSSHMNAADEWSHSHLGLNDSVGLHMSFCGHAVHQECLHRYLSSLKQRYRNRTLFEGLQIVDPNQGEFLCPVCRRLANSVLPYLAESSMPDTVREDREDRAALALQVPHAMHLLRNAEELVWKPGFRKAVSKPLSKTLKSAFDSLFRSLYDLYFPGGESSGRHNSHRVSQSLLLWDVLRYTILSVELATRAREDTFTSKAKHLDALWKAIDKGSVLPMLFRAARAIQNQNRQSLLLRARGMQLFVGSICFGLSKDSITQPSMPGVLKILQFLDNGSEAADVHLWRRTADPVLAHDPFSSLLWIIFCFPLSFPSLVEPYISLVHLLYLVCVTQIIVFMGDTITSRLSELQLTPIACGFLQSMLANFSGVYLFQRSNEQNPSNLSGPILLTIRRFTLPYLRRCTLLEKLLCDVQFEEHENDMVKAYDSITAKKTIDDMSSEERDSICIAFEDLKELKILERKFSLPSLQTLLETVENQEVIMRWCNHLAKESESRNILPLPRPVMVAPFKLMELPPLYQTLLQRYIKERCPVCKTVPEQPALCLLCGKLCCGLGRRPCCSVNRQSECYRHAMACNGGVAVYLMIRKTNILLQRCARQASWPSPYLDSFGEEDIDMHRGKPLYLNEERYAALTAMVVTHGLDHSSFVLSHTSWETPILR